MKTQKQNEAIEEESTSVDGVILKKIFERALPVWRAEFHCAINNSDDVPETYFSSRSNVASRNVKMWWVFGDGLLCLHKDEYFLVPSASVKFSKLIFKPKSI